MIAFLVTTWIEQRAGPIQGSTGFQCKHGKSVRATSLFRTCGKFSQITVIFDNQWLDFRTFIYDELKDFICRSPFYRIDFFCRDLFGHQRYITILANQAEVEVSTHKTAFILVVLITVKLGGIVVVQLQFIE